MHEHFGFVVGRNVFVTSGPSRADFEVFALRSRESFDVRHLIGIETIEYADLRGFAEAVIHHFDGEADLENFCSVLSVTIIESDAALARHRSMMREDKIDPYASDAPATTIADLYGLSKHDPWDRRTEEEKDKQTKTSRSSAASQTGGSFSDRGQTESVGEIDLTEENDPLAARIVFSDVSPTVFDKLVHDFGYSEYVEGMTTDLVRANVLAIALERRSEPFLAQRDGERLVTNVWVSRTILAAQNTAMTFFRLYLAGTYIEDVVSLAQQRSYGVLARGEDQDGVWLIFPIRRLALEAASALGIDDPDIVQVTRSGQPHETKASLAIGPRPWNAEHVAYRASHEIQKREMSKIKPAEFIFAATSDYWLGTIVYLTPKSYFEDRQAHDLDGIYGDVHAYIGDKLPRDLQPCSEIAGRYLSKTRDRDAVSNDLIRRGFLISPQLKLYINFL